MAKDLMAALGQPKMNDEPDSNPMLESAANDLITAVHAKDAKGVAEAFELMMSECGSTDYGMSEE